MPGRVMVEKPAPITIAEAKALFADLAEPPALLLAVSGGPDSVALMWLAARWRDGLKVKPKLFAATVDHGLRREAHKEALAVARLARRLKIPHRILRWTGAKPKTGLQMAARKARYELLATAAKKSGAAHLVTAHTLDDQAETVIMRMARGSGIGGLAAMARTTQRDGVTLVRPLLSIPKARLVATLAKAKIQFADDPSNRDPQFTRARLRTLMPELAREGLDARRLSQLAGRLRRAEQALEVSTDRAMADLSRKGPEAHGIGLARAEWFALPAEIRIRLLRRLVDQLGHEGPSELGKVEAIVAALMEARKQPKTLFRRSLAGAIVTLSDDLLTIEQAPARGRKPLTTAKTGRARRAKPR